MNQPRKPLGIPIAGQYDFKTVGTAQVQLRRSVDLLALTDEARSVIDACAKVGGRPLIVGGSVRDALYAAAIGQVIASKDIDIEVHGLQDTNSLIPELATVGDVDTHGVSFGVIAVRINGQDFDVSLPRRDSKTGDGHRGFDIHVDPELSMDEAFSRRDFTINAMGWDPETGDLIDPFGGAQDLHDRILRHTSEAFVEDPLRVLRGVQFAARFDMELAPETIELCRSMKDEFAQLPPSRVWGEFDKIGTKGVRPSRALDALHQTGWEEHFPTLAAVRGVRQDPTWHPEGTVDVHLGMAADSAAQAAIRNGATEDERRIAVLGAMLHDLGKATHTDVPDQSSALSAGERITSHGHAEAGVDPAADFLDRIGAPGHVKDKVLPLISAHMYHAGIKGDPQPSTVRKLVRRLAGNGTGPTIHDWARVVDADVTGRGAGSKEPFGSRWVAIAESLPSGTKPGRSILRGNHLMGMGMKPGPNFARIITASLEAQDDGLFDDEAGALEWVKAHVRRQ